MNIANAPHNFELLTYWICIFNLKEIEKFEESSCWRFLE